MSSATIVGEWSIYYIKQTFNIVLERLLLIWYKMKEESKVTIGNGRG